MRLTNQNYRVPQLEADLVELQFSAVTSIQLENGELKASRIMGVAAKK